MKEVKELELREENEGERNFGASNSAPEIHFVFSKLFKDRVKGS